MVTALGRLNLVERILANPKPIRNRACLFAGIRVTSEAGRKVLTSCVLGT